MNELPIRDVSIYLIPFISSFLKNHQNFKGDMIKEYSIDGTNL